MLKILPICPRCSTTPPPPSRHTSFSSLTTNLHINPFVWSLDLRIPSTSLLNTLLYSWWCTRHTTATMDIALELCDTYAFDYIYASLLPVRPAPYNLQGGLSNSSISSLKAASPYQWQPASKILSFPPGDAAWMSQWTRDNIYRQALSLFFITW